VGREVQHVRKGNLPEARYNFSNFFFEEFPIRSLLLILFFLVNPLLAADFIEDQTPYSARLGGGYADFNDLGEILTGNWNHYEKDTYVINLDGGWRFVEDMYDLPLDWYLKGGLSYFNENGYADDIYEVTLYVKVYWKIDFWQNRVRVGFGEGLSLATDIPIVEVEDATNEDGTVDPTAKFLNYLDISFDFDFGRLIRVKRLEEFYIGYTIKHRSGIFGTFNGVHGGSNYNMLTFVKNF
jgi:outer membrane protein